MIIHLRFQFCECGRQALSISVCLWSVPQPKHSATFLLLFQYTIIFLVVVCQLVRFYQLFSLSIHSLAIMVSCIVFTWDQTTSARLLLSCFYWFWYSYFCPNSVISSYSLNDSYFSSFFYSRLRACSFFDPASEAGTTLSLQRLLGHPVSLLPVGMLYLTSFRILSSGILLMC